MENVKKIIKYIKPYKFIAIVGPLFMVLEVFMDLLQPKIMQNIIDIGIANNDLNYVMINGAIMILVAFIGLLGGLMCIYLSTKTAINTATDIRRDLYNKIQSFSSRNIDKFQSGKLITILTSDVNSIQLATMMLLRSMVRSPLLFIGSIIMVLISSYSLSPILIIVVPFLGLSLFFIIKKSGNLFKNVQEAIDNVNNIMQENLSGIRVIKAFVRWKYEINKFDKSNDNLTKVNIDANQVMSILLPIIMISVNLGIVAALWLGGINVNNGVIEIGQLVAFLNYLIQILSSLLTFGMILVHITRAVPSINRVNEVLETKAEIADSVDCTNLKHIKGNIEFKNVSFSYNKNDEMVLTDISFKTNIGEKIGIIGPTGSGKSTLAKLIPRLYDVDKGEILVDNINTKKINLRLLRQSIGFVPQKALLFSKSIEENILYGKENATFEELEIAAKDSCSMEFISNFDDKFKHKLNQKATNLSGGQKQRLSIARAFIRKPAILILDDSTSAVDAKSEELIVNELNKSYKNTTTFIISSKISSIIDADKILVLDDGKLVGIGKHKELIRNCNVYKEIYLSQGGKEESYEN
jgi:ATP-binding cassette, subfamily B, multidrug efflux pump